MTDKIIEQLETYLQDHRQRLSNYAGKNSSYKRVRMASKEELPKLIGVPGMVGDLAKKRLSGEDIDTPKYWLQAMYDVGFDVEDYRNIGYGDGQMEVLRVVYMLLGHPDKADQALEIMYSSD